MIQQAKLHLYIHPTLQLIGIIFGYISLYWGYQRFLQAHKGKRRNFPWKDHVSYGKSAIAVWFMGIIVGLHYTKKEWSFYSITGDHFTVGMAALGIMLATLLTGYWMEWFKKKRKLLSITHGILGLLLCLLGFVQIITGVQVFTMFVW